MGYFGTGPECLAVFSAPGRLARRAYFSGWGFLAVGTGAEHGGADWRGPSGRTNAVWPVTKPRVAAWLNVVNPLVDVTRFDTRTQNYTMSAVHGEGQQAGDDAIRVLSTDGLEVVIDLTVLYHVVPDQAPKVFVCYRRRLPG